MWSGSRNRLPLPHKEYKTLHLLTIQCYGELWTNFRYLEHSLKKPSTRKIICKVYFLIHFFPWEKHLKNKLGFLVEHLTTILTWWDRHLNGPVLESSNPQGFVPDWMLKNWITIDQHKSLKYRHLLRGAQWELWCTTHRQGREPTISCILNLSDSILDNLWSQ